MNMFISEEGKGASGLPQREEDIPKWSNPRDEEHSDEMHEVRKRRLQHFAQQNDATNSSSSLDSSKKSEISEDKNSVSEDKH